MDNQTAPNLTQRAEELAQAAQTIGFMPAGVRTTIEGVAAFARDCAAAIDSNARHLGEVQAEQIKGAEFANVIGAAVADLRERLQAEASTNAELLAKLGELTERIEALEAKGA